MTKDYTVQEASNRLGCKRDAIYKALQKGKMLSHKRGVTIFIDEEEMQRWQKIRRGNYKTE